MSKTEIGNCKRYLARRLLKTRRRLLAAYRAALARTERDEASLPEELFVTEFYTVEKQITVALKELENTRKLELPRLKGGEPRIFHTAVGLAAEGPEAAIKGRFLNAELEALPECVRIASLERINALLPEEGDGRELNRALIALKAFADLDWDERIFETSPIVSELKRDGGWEELDRESKGLLVGRAQTIAKSLGVSEVSVAKRAAELPREAAFYLAADGEEELRRSLCPKRPRKPIGPRAAYILFIIVFRLSTLVISALFLKRGVLTAFLTVFPSSLIVLSTVTTLFSLAFKPRRLPRLEVKSAEGGLETAVAVPVLLTDADSAGNAVKRLETHYLSDPLEGVKYILLADLPDAKMKELDSDAESVERAKRGIAELNGIYGQRFFLLLRERTRNADGIWQGHERKRGAVTELMRLLSGGENGFKTLFPEAELSANYLAVLDADTVLPPDTLRKLIGAAAHPANAPVIRKGRAVSGYSVFAPRMRTTAKSAARSFFSRIFSGDTGYELYSAAVSNFHMDAFREGDFGGKGIINIKPFLELTDGRIGDNRVLSHDLLEGSLARAAYLDDVVLYDDEPSTLPKWWKRQERWIRGDWQLLPFMLGKRLSLINRTKMLGNLTRSLREPVLLLLMAAAVALGSTPLIAFCLAAFIFEPIKGFIILAFSSMRERSAQDGFIKLVIRTFIELAALPYAAVQAFTAIVTALFRTLISHRKMLLWTTAASSKAGEGGVTAANLVLALVFAVGAAIRPFGAVTVFAALLAALWTIGPFIVRAADRESKPAPKTKQEFVRKLFKDAWGFFVNECGENTCFLPPDNVQEYPERPAADLTSPTDIGMGIMALVSAHDLGEVGDEEFVSRAERMLASVERLNKWRGIPFNWYRVSDLSVVRPRFVSSVDAGNLAASLMVLGAALREVGANGAACERLVSDMELSALFDEKRRLFHIGFDADEGRLTPSCYDLYASEARLLSFIALSLRMAPLSHFSALSRLMRDAVGGRTLVSWSGTAFEYLMPLIFTETVPGSLQHETVLSAVRTQILGETGGTPWGRSESGYYAFDRAMRYQYRAFGEPSLALEPRRGGYKVVAPYASALALYAEPFEAISNLEALVGMGAVGKYGLIEALDYGEGASPRAVRSFMAHHKGMELCAYAAYLTGNLNAKRFMGIAKVRAMEQLFFENMPLKPIVIKAYEATVGRAETPEEPALSRTSSGFTIDGVLLSNGERSTHVFTDGTSVSRLNEILLANDLEVTLDGARIAGECLSGPHAALFTEEKNGLIIRENIITASVLPAELREITLVNRSYSDRSAALGISFRPILVPEREFYAHPEFVRLTVDARRREDAVLFRLRKKRGRKELWLYAALVSDTPADLSRCSDTRFISKIGFALKPSGSAKAVFIMGAAERETDAIKQLKKLKKTCGQEESMARLAAMGLMREALVKPKEAVSFEPLMARIEKRVPFKQLTAPRAKEGVEKLWEMGISGDKPIVAVSIDSPEQLDDMKRFAAFCRFASMKGLSADFCVLSSLSLDYGDPARTRLNDLFGGTAAILDRELLPEDGENALISMSLIAARADAVPYAPILKKRERVLEPMPTEPIKRRKLLFDNGIGGFDTEREEYVICAPTPAPWSNVIANEGFGTLVTANGGGYTWCENSRLMRLTPWDCDPERDAAHERVTLEENGFVLPLMPYGAAGNYEISHGLGYTASRCSSHGLEAELYQFVDSARPVKYFLVRLTNRTESVRMLTVSLDIDWAMGEEPHPEALIFKEEDGVLFVDSARRGDDGRRAFVTGTERRVTVFGGETETAVFMLGMDSEVPEADAERELENVKKIWKKCLSALTIRTRDEAFDLLVNRLLLYQTISSRILAKTGYYQSGGAVGFRDRLQDALALLLTEPDTARGIILDSAAHQFGEGDVLHWWHGKARGVRTRISDDRLFLPFVCLEYVKVTGDASVWDERVPFLEGEPLARTERDRYAEFGWGEGESLFAHCVRAIKISMVLGKNGLPLMGAGDWNDGFDEVGGESVFVGFLLLKVLEGFVPVCRGRDAGLAAELAAFAENLRQSLENTWEEDRYIRAVRWDGARLGSKHSEECSVDLISAVWAVFCGMSHAEEAFDTALNELLDRENGVLKLLAPPFTDASPVSAGYIEAYREGKRENGGQYTHAAAWAVIAACLLKRRETASELFHMLDPIERGNAQNIKRYRTEPYSVAADVGGFGDNLGVGGWTWYTGAAGWLYQAAVNHILGIKKEGETLRLEPCTDLDEFTVKLRHGSSTYIVHAKRGEGPNEMRLADDGRPHEEKLYYQ